MRISYNSSEISFLGPFLICEGSVEIKSSEHGRTDK